MKETTRRFNNIRQLGVKPNAEQNRQETIQMGIEGIAEDKKRPSILDVKPYINPARLKQKELDARGRSTAEKQCFDGERRYTILAVSEDVINMRKIRHVLNQGRLPRERTPLKELYIQAMRDYISKFAMLVADYEQQYGEITEDMLD